ncbi:MAG: hypothetical protein ACLUW6_04475 [Coriobacteriaceae bacterium]
MDFAVILIATIVGCFALRNPLKALPVAFYAAAIGIDVVYVYGVFFGLPRAIWSRCSSSSRILSCRWPCSWSSCSSDA